MLPRKTYQGVGYVPSGDNNPLGNPDELVVLLKSDRVLFAQGDRYVQITLKDAYDLAAWLGKPLPKELGEIRDELVEIRNRLVPISPDA